MKGTRVSPRYAKSLLDLALEQGLLEQVKNDMATINEVCKGSREFIQLLSNPIIKTDKKEAILKEIFGGRISTLTFKFLEIITSRKREDHIPSIAVSFLDQYKKHKQILTAVITTTVGLDETLRNKVMELVKTSANKEVELIEKIDKNLIGGFILNVGDKQIDSSVLGKLSQLKRDFSENPYIKEY